MNKINSTYINSLSDETIIDNILQSYERACNVGLDVQCKHWYKQAHTDCIELAEEFSLPLDNIIGMVSALSPRMPWIWNIANTARLLRGKTTTAYKANEDKARRIWNGERPMDVLGGLKTQAFYQNIASSGTDDNVVTVDTWAIRVACGKECGRTTVNSITPKTYNRLQGLYQKASRFVSVNAVQLQAITWQQCRNENGYNDSEWKVIE